MFRELKHHGMNLLLSAVIAGAGSSVITARVLADDAKPAEKATQNQPTDEAKKAEEAKRAEAQPAKVDPHAGHDHGPNVVGPPAAGAQNLPVKPGADIPSPTVVLKPGEVPAIKFDTPIYDFGRVKSGSDIKHDFYFTNTGTGPLEILRVKPSCGCTVAGQYDRIVQPNETGKIPLTMSSKGASGPLSKNVTVNTNIAGADSTISLQIKGEVWQPIQVTPQAASFGRITAQDSGDKLVRKLTIASNVEAPVTLGEPISSHPKVKASVSTLEPGKRFEVVVTLEPPFESGNINGRVTIPTGVADMPNVEISAYAFVTAAIDVSPTTLILPPSRTADVTRQFYIRSNINKPFNISDLATSNPDIKLELTDVKDSITYRLKVDVPTGYAPPAGGDRITMKTDSPDVPTITIPVNSQAVSPANPLTNIGQKRITPPGSASVSATADAAAAPKRAEAPAPAESKEQTKEEKKDPATKG
ncbi:MAG: DUF1573 domain-containing protein [Phycisphaerae bacterium]|nr:DUF1573 domain-containing protein [Phycisphaerae bacterium]